MRLYYIAFDTMIQTVLRISIPEKLEKLVASFRRLRGVGEEGGSLL
ncbi:hypothetical protein PORCRE_1257 [Porphyromonas crevioricanis JCM 15906]|uniref:Uncharacterized protein n=1 Tax=Porphyromonas crevioricanis JCM 15906 TaxID=1305617 RepID=T1CNY2_9PORP|nr:hypothetical protein PORCRE_1257 [Porphyromonas crevioricanis JCM 15906]GAD07825.1 hypothetical protein PORCAN_1453 [Porphyromonas crevioricanis JCM 13913]